jgi:hypothetical protein
MPAASSASVEVSIRDGHVSLSATNATLGEIFSAWARAGETTILNADKLTSPPLTIELNDVPEEKALAVLLRSASGYLAVPRRAARADRSRFDRIVILPTSSARETGRPIPVPPQPMFTPPPPPVVDQNGVARVIGPDGRPLDDDQTDAPPPVMPQPIVVQPAAPAPPSSAAPIGTPIPGMVPAAPQPQEQLPGQYPQSTSPQR